MKIKASGRPAYKRDIAWGETRNFATWEEWCAVRGAESDFVGPLFQAILSEMSRVYWNTHEEAWGDFLCDEGRWFPIEMGQLAARTPGNTKEDSAFLEMHLCGLRFDLEIDKPRRNPYLHESQSASDWARWFTRCLIEIRHYARDTANYRHGAICIPDMPLGDVMLGGIR